MEQNSEELLKHYQAPHFFRGNTYFIVVNAEKDHVDHLEHQRPWVPFKIGHNVYYLLARGKMNETANVLIGLGYCDRSVS